MLGGEAVRRATRGTFLAHRVTEGSDGALAEQEVETTGGFGELQEELEGVEPQQHVRRAPLSHHRPELVPGLAPLEPSRRGARHLHK